MSKEIIANTDIMKPEVMKQIGQTIASDCSPIELEAFCRMCAMTGLNPLTKEAYAIKYQGRMSFIVSLAGYLKFANSHPAYDGCELYYGPELTDNGVKAPQYVECKVYRKDRSRPTSFRAYWREYNKGQALWKTMPSLMLAKCAKSGAHRESFVSELGGTYTFDEMPEDVTVTASEPTPTEEVKTQSKEPEKLKQNENGTKSYKLKPTKVESVEVPFESEPEPESYKYDLSKLSDEKYDAVVEYLDNFDCFEMKPDKKLISVEPLSRLKNYQVK